LTGLTAFSGVAFVVSLKRNCVVGPTTLCLWENRLPITLHPVLHVERMGEGHYSNR
jgi:hypothetical protein